MDPFTIASKIDHTLLKPDIATDSIKQLCKEAIEYGFYSVCINSVWLKYEYKFGKSLISEFDKIAKA